MAYGVRWDGGGREAARGACALVAAVCCVALLLMTVGWLAGLGPRAVWSALASGWCGGGAVCERCGRVPGAADAGHACEEER